MHAEVADIFSVKRKCFGECYCLPSFTNYLISKCIWVIMSAHFFHSWADSPPFWSKSQSVVYEHKFCRSRTLQSMRCVMVFINDPLHKLLSKREMYINTYNIFLPEREGILLSKVSLYAIFLFWIMRRGSEMITHVSIKPCPSNDSFLVNTFFYFAGFLVTPLLPSLSPPVTLPRWGSTIPSIPHFSSQSWSHIWRLPNPQTVSATIP